jgi:hypothetical protein
MHSSSAFLKSLADVNFHRPGPKALELFRVEGGFFERLRAELEQLTERHAPSKMTDYGHSSSWANPYGNAVQFSLLNKSGRLDDTSTDHNLSTRGKAFHHAEEFPTLAQLIRAFPHATNMRLNGMGKKSGLSPHDENVVHWCGPGRPRDFFVRARFHLPIQTNPGAHLLMGGEKFHFEERRIYFFHNGTVHSANNEGDTYRYHLVWDMLLTQQTYEQMFLGLHPAPFLQAVPQSEQRVPPVGALQVDDFELSGLGLRLYRLLQLQRLGVKKGMFQTRVFDPIARRAPVRLVYSDVR